MPPHPLLPCTILAAALALPAAAQDADPANQMVEGIMACFSAAGDAGLTTASLAAGGWSREDSDEEGLIYFTPGAGEATLVYMANDASFCHVESTVIGSAAAAKLAAQTLAPPEGAPFTTGKDAMGCTRLDFESGITATITSGGNDPVCDSPADSGIRFEFRSDNE